MISPERIQEALDASVLSTFESMLFLEVQASALALPVTEPLLSVTIAASAPVACEMTLVAPRGTAHMLQDILYAGVEVRSGMDSDTLAELLNVIAGCFLTELDDSHPIALGLPTAGGGELLGASGSSLQRQYHSDEGSIGLRVSVHL
jgi:hypothetical protein